MSNKIYLGAYHGGLGDSLQFSTLPELFSQRGNDVYIWENAPFRNPEIYDLVWGTNPFVKGRSQGTWNAGDIPTIQFENLTGNCISNWEVLHGLPASNRYPKIYYQPQILKDFTDKCIVDLSSVSMNHEHEEVFTEFEKLNKNLKGGMLNVRFQKQISNSQKVHRLSVVDEICVKNIFEYCDIIASCSEFVSLHSGQSHLASAIKNQYNHDMDLYCILRKSEHDHHVRKGTFIFENVRYITH